LCLVDGISIWPITRQPQFFALECDPVVRWWFAAVLVSIV
jgi:hypothetical protein